MIKKILIVCILFSAYFAQAATNLATLDQDADNINNLRLTNGNLSSYSGFADDVVSILSALGQSGTILNSADADTMRKIIITRYLKNNDTASDFLPETLPYDNQDYYKHCLFLTTLHHAASYAAQQRLVYFLTVPELANLIHQKLQEGIHPSLGNCFNSLDNPLDFIKDCLGPTFINTFQSLTENYADIPYQWVIQITPSTPPSDKANWLALPYGNYIEKDLIAAHGFKAYISQVYPTDPSGEPLFPSQAIADTIQMLIEGQEFLMFKVAP